MASDATRAVKSNPDILSVTQLTRRVKSCIEQALGRVWVSGEISNFRVSPSGHSYFTLKDEFSQLSAVMFKGRLSLLKFEPANGLEVIVRGSVTVYEQRGNYQIICDDMHPKGVGALQLAYEKLKQKLQAEGLFDEAHKKPLPLLPKRIGIVTSPTGAAIRDILNVIGRRFASVHILLYPARVQGVEAPPEIVAGIQALDAYGVDVIIVGRGGGSLEDLWAFNDEKVVRAIFAAKTPIISAVGHEIDVTLCDFVADLRAPTPSAAAELVVKEHEALAAAVRQLERRLARSMRDRVASAVSHLDRLKSSYVFRRSEELTRGRRQQSDELQMRLHAAMEERIANERARLDAASRALGLLSPVNQLARSRERLASTRRRMFGLAPAAVERARARFGALAGKLDSLSPLAILGRGYALAWHTDGTLVCDARMLATGERLHLRFGQGGATVRVEEIRDTP